MADRIDRITEDVQEIRKELDQRFDAVDRRFATIDQRFAQVDEAIREQREYTEFAYGRMDNRFDQMQLGFGRLEAKVDERFGRLERKLDAVIDTRPARRQPKRGR